MFGRENRAAFHRVGLTFSLLLCAGAQAQELAADPGASELDLFQLDSQMQQAVVSSTRTEQRSAQTPAVVTVIEAEEIEARGFSSLAEVLRLVPGFYDVYDLVTHNVGVRGINGGARASGSVVKLMIDGQAVDYRPTTGNFFGEELIPLQAVQRVEIIRGPASALYGANAFLGVVNVITKRGASVGGLRLVAQGALVRDRPGGGGGLVMGGGSEGVDVLLAVNQLWVDRSGRALPSSSPALRDPRAGEAWFGASQGDIARPGTFFGKAAVDAVGGTFSVLASVQRLDSSGEFQENGVLTHGTRVQMVNQHYRLAYQVSPSDILDVTVASEYFDGRPGRGDRVDTGRSDYFFTTHVGANGGGLSAVAQLRPLAFVSLTGGADWVQEDHLLQTFDLVRTEDVLSPDGTVVRRAGEVVPGENAGVHKNFHNVGAYVQGLLNWKDDWSAVVGARVDRHSLYGVNPTARAGIVYAPAQRPISVKLLYGSSFKAPSAVQLYTRPVQAEDILGNSRLRAQTARTLELAAAYGLGERAELSANLFFTQVSERVEFLRSGSYLRAQNLLGESHAGLELDSRFAVTSFLHLRLSLGLARNLTRDESPLLVGVPEVINSLFPAYQIHGVADYRLPWAGLTLGTELSYISQRETSQSNAVIFGRAYELDAYFYGAVSLSTGPMKWVGSQDTRISLRVSNVLGAHFAESGFNGVDVPTQGTTAFLTLIQSL